jgi:hypothetical protein
VNLPLAIGGDRAMAYMLVLMLLAAEVYIIAFLVRRMW